MDRSGPSLVFFDGTCGFCHRAVRFLLARDPTGTAFRFAPLESRLAAQVLPSHLRPERPGSIVVRTPEGRLLGKAAAVRHLGTRVGGGWRIAAASLHLVPTWLADSGYDLVAAVRHRLGPVPDQTCPRVPPELRARFES